MNGTVRPHRRQRLAAVAALVAASLGLLAPPAHAQTEPTVTVLTRNLYVGGNLNPSMTAPNLPAFLAANATLLSHVDLVDFPARAKLIAEEIREHKPDVVGLQEVATWRTGPIGDPADATTVRYDYLSLLLSELATSGHPYDLAVQRQEADLEVPAGAPYNLDVRVTTRDVILVRHGGRVKVTDTSFGNVVHNVVIPLRATGGEMTSTRGWTAIDVVHGRRAFRVVNTHLEAFDAEVRAQQAKELLAGPLDRPGRVVLVGDLNTGPDGSDDDRIAYDTLVAGGMVDTWPILHPGEPGHTAGLGDDLTAPADDVEHRIDMVMVRGAVVPVASEVFGTERQTADGRWASDHLGYVATLALP